jgi:hypothetical protein
MSRKWKVAIGVVSIAAVIALIALPLLGRWLIFRGSGVPFARGFGPGHGVPFGRDFDRGRGMPFGRGFGPGRGMPFGFLFDPFAIIGGLMHVGFFALLIAAAALVFRRCWSQRERPDSAAPAASSE